MNNLEREAVITRILNKFTQLDSVSQNTALAVAELMGTHSNDIERHQDAYRLDRRAHSASDGMSFEEFLALTGWKRTETN